MVLQGYGKTHAESPLFCSLIVVFRKTDIQALNCLTHVLYKNQDILNINKFEKEKTKLINFSKIFRESLFTFPSNNEYPTILQSL